MKASKTLQYDGKDVDLSRLTEDIVTFLQSDGFKVQNGATKDNKMLIQAQKGGFFREIITAERALNILIDGSPNSFTVTVGIGKWVQNIAVTMAETVLLTELFLPLDVAEMLWNFNVEQKVVAKIDRLVNEESATAVIHPAPAG